MATTVLDTIAVLESLLKSNKVHRNLRAGPLVEQMVRHGEGHLADNGALAAYTGKYTRRLSEGKATIRDSKAAAKINWGDINLPLDAGKFDPLFEKIIGYLRCQELCVEDLYAWADSKHRLPVRVINELAWQNFFEDKLFVRPSSTELKRHCPELTIICAPGFKSDCQCDGLASESFVTINPSLAIMLVGDMNGLDKIKRAVEAGLRLWKFSRADGLTTTSHSAPESGDLREQIEPQVSDQILEDKRAKTNIKSDLSSEFVDRRIKQQRAAHSMKNESFLIKFACIFQAIIVFAALGLFYFQGLRLFGFALDKELMHWIGSATIGAIGAATLIVYRAIFKFRA